MPITVPYLIVFVITSVLMHLCSMFLALVVFYLILAKTSKRYSNPPPSGRVSIFSDRPGGVSSGPEA